MRLPHFGPIATSSVQTIAVYGLRLIVQLALLLLVARYLGPSDFGEFAGLAALAFGLGTLSSFGLGFLVLGDSAKSPKQGKLLLAASVPATVLSAAILGPFYLWLCRSLLASDAAFSALVFIGLSELLLSPLIILIAQRLQGLGFIWPSQLITVIPIAMRVLGILACITMVPGQGLGAYATAYFLATAAGLSIAYWSSGPRVRLNALKMPRTDQFRKGMPYAFMKFTAINPAELDKAMALRLLSSYDAGLYSLAARGLALATLPVAALVVSSQPRLFRIANNHDPQSIKLPFTLVSASGIAGITAGLLLAFGVAPFLQTFLGTEYVDIGKVLSYLSLAAPFLAVRIACGGIMIPLGQPLHRSGIEISGLAVLLSLGIFFGINYGYRGIITAVILSEAVMAVTFCIYLYFYFKKKVSHSQPHRTL